MSKLHYYLGRIIPAFVIAFLAGCQSLTDTSSAPLDNRGWITEGSFYEKTVYYGTTRADKCVKLIKSPRIDKSSKAYENCLKDTTRLNTGNHHTVAEIHFGSVKVKIPYVKRVGGTDGMSLTELRHDVGWNKFKSMISDDDLFVFVHGFNTNFDSAAIRCAQLAHDTNFKGKAIFFSWPSREHPATYGTDQKRANENIDMLADFLQNVAASTDKKIHVVAHSMGTYILTKSLAKLDERILKDNEILSSRRRQKNGKVFSQIILAAPDIGQDDYYKQFSTSQFSRLVDNITLYASVNDHVLDVSSFVNIYLNGSFQPRLGDSSSGFFVVDGMDTIDARLEIKPQIVGHSYYANYRSFVSDMYLLFKYGTEPEERMLQKVVDKNGKVLWFMRN